MFVAYKRSINAKGSGQEEEDKGTKRSRPEIKTMDISNQAESVIDVMYTMSSDSNQGQIDPTR